MGPVILLMTAGGVTKTGSITASVLLTVALGLDEMPLEAVTVGFM